MKLFASLFIIVIVATIRVASAQDSLFAPAVTYGAGNYPVSIVAADFDGDQNIDLAAANYTYNNVIILRGNGDGTFQAPVAYTTGNCAYSVAAADIDGDGHIDLAVADRAADSVAVLYNIGNGTFLSPQKQPVGSNPVSIAAADLNGDSLIDLVTANQWSYNVSVLINQGNRNFAPAANYGIGQFPASVSIGDFDDDGHNDLVTCAQYTPYVKTLMNNGGGTFVYGDSFLVTNPVFVYCWLDTFQHIDFAVLTQNPDSLKIFINYGGGNFQNFYNYSLPGSLPTSMVTAELNNDGYPEVAVTAFHRNNVWINLNYGYPVGLGPVSICAADFDHDGDIDLATANFTAGNISVLLNRTAETGIDDSVRSKLPGNFYLVRNYPNPFNAKTTISYNLSQSGPVTLSIYNIMGQKVATLVDGTQNAGEHKVIWDAGHLPSGVYFYRLKAGATSKTEKCVLLK